MKGFLFEGGAEDEVWRREWKDMPEFVQEDLSPFKSITVNFESEQDIKAFSELIGQRVTARTQSIYYPKMEIDGMMNKRYVDGVKTRIKRRMIEAKNEP